MTADPSYHQAVSADFQRECDEQEDAERHGFDSPDDYADYLADLRLSAMRDNEYE